MELKNLRSHLSTIGEKVIKDARANLSAHTDTGRLSRETKYKLVTKGKGLALTIEMPKYGDVLDKGASGSLLKRDNTPYTIRPAATRAAERITGTQVYTNWKSISAWVDRKGIIFPNRSKSSTSFLINRALKRDGYPPTLWLTKAKKKNKIGTKTYRKGMLKAFKEDIKAHRKEQRLI